jgi:hypothetical protein
MHLEEVGIFMPTDTQMPISQRLVQICLILFAAIALSGGGLQMYLGQPETTPRLDNVHLIGLAVFLAGCGRLLSISIVGLPDPPALWLGYLVPELLVSVLMVAAQLVANRSLARQGV